MTVETGDVEAVPTLTENESLIQDVNALRVCITRKLVDSNMYMRLRGGGQLDTVEVISPKQFAEGCEPEGLFIDRNGNWTNGLEEVDGQEMVNVLAQFACLTHEDIAKGYSALLRSESTVQRLMSEGKVEGSSVIEHYDSYAGDFNASIQAYVRNNMTELLKSLRGTLTQTYFKR